MSEMRALFGQFLVIQNEQNDLLKEIARKDSLLQFWKNSAEIGAHGRDCHGSHWDSSIAVEEQQKLYKELVLLRQQYEQNRERLKELYKTNDFARKAGIS